jgi:hypothetical protein
LEDTLLSLGFRRTLSEHAIYVWWNDNVQLVVGVYIDDLISTGSDRDDIKLFKEEMTTVFKMSDLGLLHYYLDIEVKQSMSGISLSQGAYTMKILERSGMTGCNPCHVPMEACLMLSKQSTQPLVDTTTEHRQELEVFGEYSSRSCICCWLCESFFGGATGGSPCSSEEDSPLGGGYL